MFAEERRIGILNILMNKKKIKVKELSEKFKVSEVIIRKDLKLLEEEGKLERTHGGAISKREIPIDISLRRRKLTNLEGKNKIVDKLYKIIKEDEIIFLDSSSTNLLLAEKLAHSPKKITVVTNMLDIMNKLESVSEINLLGIGGSYNRTLGTFLGGMTLASIQKINTQKLFLGGAGIDVSKGNLSIFDSNEAEIKKAMIKMTSKVYFVCEEDKFHSYGLYNFATLDEIDGLVVDKELDLSIKEKLEDLGIEIF